MVSPGFAFQPAKNTIDDAHYMINMEYLFFYNQYVINSGHSHSMVAGGLPDMS